MKLLCIEDDRTIAEDFLIVGLLGHTDIGLFTPEETPLSTIICPNHFLTYDTPRDREGKSLYDIEDLKTWKKGLVFSVARGKRIAPESPSQFSPLNEHRRLKESGDWAKARLLPAFVVSGLVSKVYVNLTNQAFFSQSPYLSPLKEGFLKHVQSGGNRHQQHQVYAYEVTRREKASAGKRVSQQNDMQVAA